MPYNLPQSSEVKESLIQDLDKFSIFCSNPGGSTNLKFRDSDLNHFFSFIKEPGSNNSAIAHYKRQLAGKQFINWSKF